LTIFKISLLSVPVILKFTILQKIWIHQLLLISVTSKTQFWWNKKKSTLRKLNPLLSLDSNTCQEEFHNLARRNRARVLGEHRKTCSMVSQIYRQQRANHHWINLILMIITSLTMRILLQFKRSLYKRKRKWKQRHKYHLWNLILLLLTSQCLLLLISVIRSQ